MAGFVRYLKTPPSGNETSWTERELEAIERALASINANMLNWGAGSPEGVVAAPVGALYSRTDGGAGTTLYVKESGTGNTGWIGK